MRGFLLAEERRLAAVYDEVEGAPFAARAAALLAGEDVVVRGYDLPHGVVEHPMGRYRVDGDGTVSEVEP